MLDQFKWDKVRHLVLTVDPARYEDGHDAWKDINGRALIRDLMRNLKRVKGRKIGFWCWFLEWHRNGFPHWHVLVESDAAGRSGMIGQGDLHHYWPVGRLRESYFKTDQHWGLFSGYIKKHGYIEKKKAHQGRLPNWGLEYTGRIRRFDGAHMKREKEERFNRGRGLSRRNWVDYYNRIEARDWLKMNGGRPYRVVLEECGAFSDVEIEFMGQQGSYYRIPIAVSEFKRVFGGRYEEGVGWCFQCEPGSLKALCDRAGCESLVRFIEFASG